MYETRNDLAETTRKAVVQLVNDRLAEAIDLFTEVSRGIDKLLWMVEAHVQK